MCLAIPGKIISVTTPEEAPDPLGTVDFHGSRIEVSLACTPEAGVGDWVLVHSGFAISVLDEAEARETWELLQHDEQFRELAAESTGADL